ncbi:transglycosylase family protein [Nocardioides sp. HDW12B]|uniref:transglycosylase family protein n=1 Tax=Nocardioides sp. HDW12B TaxID=2714939 RepID=UPI00140A78AA|nr:transglycosylase family protein [Nocardioides sp. HDW12B]QIK66150.1 transglycosylase family protein [Nocardioides sp. HDW12B]
MPAAPSAHALDVHSTTSPSPARRTTPASLAAALLGALALLASLVGVASPAVAHTGPSNWDCLAHYESTHRWAINSGNGHYGGLQFSLSTWRYYGGPNHSGNAYPHKATKAEQIYVAKRVAWHGWNGHRAQGGRNAWPNTWSHCF